ncbi:hypothetical protein GSF67_17200 [Agrobacterium sp. CGMCC 11546]|nr:hypothetical protein GSF67_17200 [Agrobacterium sp. CGMCC 11546]
MRCWDGKRGRRDAEDRLSPLFLIPVLVTGIQPAQVFGLKELFPPCRREATGFL